MSFFSNIGNFFSHAGNSITKIVNSSPILRAPARTLAAPVQLGRDIVTGKNVANSIGTRGVQALAGGTYQFTATNAILAGSKPGQAVIGIGDKLTGNTPSQLLAAPTALYNIENGQTVQRNELLDAFKSTAIGSAKVGAAVETFGLASGAAAGLGASSTVASGAGVFGASKILSPVDNILSGKGKSGDFLAAASAFTGGGDYADLASSFLGGLDSGNAPQSPAASGFLGFSDPYGASTSSPAPAMPKPQVSAAPVIAVIVLASYFALRRNHA